MTLPRSPPLSTGFSKPMTSEVDLVTSELTLTEIKAYQGSSRPAIERTFRLLEKVPIVRWDELLGTHSYGDERTWIDVPMS
jgi:hypothetical protein